MEQNNHTVEVVSYELDKIQLLLNILNSMDFKGIQQAQGIVQINTILNNPVKYSEDKKESEV